MLLELNRLSIGILRDQKTFSAVDELSFGLERGEIAGMVGESGCGKSLSCLSIPGLLPPAAKVTGGSISFEGRSLLARSERELRLIRGKEIAMVFQEPRLSLNPLIPVGKQIAETLELHGQGDKRAVRLQTHGIMERLGLPEPERLAKAYPHQLSGGMCQRVMIALAVICRPQLLIADEPATALDPGAQEQITGLLRQINRDLGTAVLFVSHDLDLVRRLCSRVFVMYAGKLLEEGASEEVFTRPLHPYTRLLIGAIPRRELKGRPLANIPGKAPSVEDEKRGCPFAPRCAEARDACRSAFPARRTVGGAHHVHCLLDR